MTDSIAPSSSFRFGNPLFPSEKKQPPSFRLPRAIAQFVSSKNLSSYKASVFPQGNLAYLFQNTLGMQRNINQAIASILFSRWATQKKDEKEQTVKALRKIRLGGKITKSHESKTS